MDHQHAYRRYMEIDRCLNSKRKYWTKKELFQALLDKDFKISESTLEKDIYRMRYETSLPFQNAPIEFCHTKKAYHYTAEFAMNIPVSDEEVHSLEVAARTLNQFKDIAYFYQFAGAVDKVIRFVKQIKANHQNTSSPVILFEKVPYLKGYEYLDAILFAIEHQKCLLVDYRHFGREPYTIELHPYFVKEFHNRWYVVGYLAEKNDLRTYALDRIEYIRPCSSAYAPNTSIDPEEYFKDCIGINFMGRKVELVKLSFSMDQGNYVKTQHLHRSQTIAMDGPDRVVVDLHIIINHELKMLILSFGDQVKVLEPSWLAGDIAAISLSVVNSYNPEP